MDTGISHNIFLHQYLNWDVTLRQHYVNTYRGFERIDWWRTKLGTTFNVDTTVWDWHGPHSGTSMFSRVETSFENQTGQYRSFDLNLDARYHFPITRRSGLAFRVAGGQSFGPAPTAYVWGSNNSFRGIPLFSQSGNSYVLQSSEFRIPILDAIGAVFSGPIGEGFSPLTVYMDVRGGLYNDIGDIWYAKTPVYEGHKNFKFQQSAGVFVNIPTFFGLNVRFSKGYVGKKGYTFWIG